MSGWVLCALPNRRPVALATPSRSPRRTAALPRLAHPSRL